VRSPGAERCIFEAFLGTVPEFAGESVAEFDRPMQDPPDIVCITARTRRQIGVELTSWLDQRQMGAAKGVEAVQESILKAIQPEPPNNTEHIQFAWLHSLLRARVKPADGPALRSEFMKLVYEVDARWSSEPAWRSPQGCPWKDFLGYPTLGKYLSQVVFFPRSAYAGSMRGNQYWITFPCRGGSYSEHPMVEALLTRLAAKIQKYTAIPANLSEFHLLVHYDQARAYNSPVETPFVKFKDAARVASAFVADDPGAFARIFLFCSNESVEVYQLYP